MPVSEKQKQSAYKYKARKIKRVPLDMQISDYDKLATIAAKCGKSINGFIKEAISEKIEREKPE